MELQLIFELLKSGDFVDQDVLTKVDWELFIDLAMHHRIYPVLYKGIKMMDENVIPHHVIEALSRQYKRNTFQMLHFSAEIEHVSKLFLNNQIKLLFLKGPILSHQLYGDISLRTSGDLDVLIPIDELEKAEQLLLERGYNKDDYIKTVLNDWKWRHHHITYIHPEKMIKLEIHWRLHPGPGKEPSFDELWERKSMSKLTSYPTYTLNNEDLFIYLVSHGARHGWSRFRWLFDVHQLINQDINHHEIYKLLKRFHLLHIGGQSIILSSHLLGTHIPKDMNVLQTKKSGKLAKQSLFYLENIVNLHTDPVPKEVSQYHKHHLFSLMSAKQKFFFIMSFLYPYPEDATTLPLPTSLHFLYFPLRPFLWIWRKTRKYAFS